jgi:cyclopropane fatty-acyl-phospholipid synthase-like methyltransferase
MFFNKKEKKVHDSEREFTVDQDVAYLNEVAKRAWTMIYQPTYNPNNHELVAIEGERNQASVERVEFMGKSFDFSDIGSYLDIGSQIGYFVFILGQKYNLVAQGIEMEPVTTNYANSIVRLNDIKNTSFTNAKLTWELAEKLPYFDLISSLSVFHHTVHFDGFEAADKIMKTLAKKCNYLAFETGQFDEKGYYWSEDLSFMGDDPNQWVIDYVKSLGFEIISSKDFGTHLSDKSRKFVCAKRIK